MITCDNSNMFQRGFKKHRDDVESKRRRFVPQSLAQLAVVVVFLITLVYVANHAAQSQASCSTSPVLNSGIYSGRQCTPQQADRQAKLIAAARIRGCSANDDAWLRLLQLLIPNARVFVDIGSNKGFTAARFFELWSPELGINAPTLHKTLKHTTVEKDLIECGACMDCKSC